MHATNALPNIAAISIVTSIVFGSTRTQAQDAYIIVHALNPEGVEIATIEGVHPQCVEVYDGDRHIGYGASNVDTYSKPMPTSPGNHTINVDFNGMRRTQVVRLAPGETRTLTFAFPRTVFDMNGVLKQYLAGRARASWSYASADDMWNDYYSANVVNYIHYRQWQGSGAFAVYYVFYTLGFDDYDNAYPFEGSMSLEYDVTTYHMVCDNAVGFGVFASWSNFDFAQKDWWAYRDLLIIDNLPEASNTFKNWFSQYNAYGPYPDIRIVPVGFPKAMPPSYVISRRAEGNDPPDSPDYRDGYFCRLIPAGNTYNQISHSVFANSAANKLDVTATLTDFRFSSVPYDLTGTGLAVGNNQPPIAEFDYTIDKTMITFDASPSYDPDGGGITKYAWSFDGDIQEGQRVGVVYSEPGVRNITLTVTDDEGDKSSRSIDLPILIVGDELGILKLKNYKEFSDRAWRLGLLAHATGLLFFDVVDFFSDSTAADIVKELYEDEGEARVELLKSFKAIADDPPDANYVQVIQIESFEVISAKGDTALELAMIEWLNDIAEEVAIAQALLASLERYQGALEAHENESAALQATAIKDYSKRMEESLTQLTRSCGELAGELGVLEEEPALADEIERIREELASRGFTAEEAQHFRSLGISDAEIEAYKEDMLLNFEIGDFGNALGEFQDALDEGIAANADLSAQARHLVEMLAAAGDNPQTPGNRAPVAPLCGSGVSPFLVLSLLGLGVARKEKGANYLSALFSLGPTR